MNSLWIEINKMPMYDGDESQIIKVQELDTNKTCSKCNMRFTDVTGYVCNHVGCPMGCGQRYVKKI